MPFSLPKTSFENKECLLKAWEGFTPELINQRMCRMILGVQKKSSRLAVLGELSRYPLLLKALAQCLKYEHMLNHNTNSNSLISIAIAEMRNMDSKGIECWFSKVRQIKKSLGFRDFPRHIHPAALGKKISNFLKSNFETFWLKEVNKIKLGADGHDHNKLRLYRTIKGSFKIEPYVDMIKNRNQRCSLTRLRISAHSLHIETGRYTRPVSTPISSRICKYCSDSAIDDEAHFLLACGTFAYKRACFFSKLNAILPNFINLSVRDRHENLAFGFL